MMIRFYAIDGGAVTCLYCTDGGVRISKRDDRRRGLEKKRPRQIFSGRT